MKQRPFDASWWDLPDAMLKTRFYPEITPLWCSKYKILMIFDLASRACSLADLSDQKCLELKMHCFLIYKKQNVLSAHRSVGRFFWKIKSFGKNRHFLESFLAELSHHFATSGCLRMCCKIWQKRGGNPFSDAFRLGGAGHISWPALPAAQANITSLGAPLTMLLSFDNNYSYVALYVHFLQSR